MSNRDSEIINNTELNTNEILKDDIEYYIDLFCNEYGIDKNEIRPQQWTALMSYIGINYIKANHILSIYLDRIPYNRYNYFAVDRFLDRYIDLCNIYNQSITIIGFSKFSNITTETIYQWKNDNNKNIMFINNDGSTCNNIDLINSNDDNRVRQVTIKPSDIYQKLIKNIEQNLDDMVIDSKRKGIGAVVRYNNFHENHKSQTPEQHMQQLDSSELARQLGIDSQLIAIQEKK